MQCPKCQSDLLEGDVICVACDYILDNGFLGDDILDERTGFRTAMKVIPKGSLEGDTEQRKAHVRSLPSSSENPSSSSDTVVNQSLPSNTNIKPFEPAATEIQSRPQISMQVSVEYEKTVVVKQPTFSQKSSKSSKGEVFDTISPEGNQNPARAAQAMSAFLNAQKAFEQKNYTRAKVLSEVALGIEENPRYRALLEQCESALGEQ